VFLKEPSIQRIPCSVLSTIKTLRCKPKAREEQEAVVQSSVIEASVRRQTASIQLTGTPTIEAEALLIKVVRTITLQD